MGGKSNWKFSFSITSLNIKQFIFQLFKKKIEIDNLKNELDQLPIPIHQTSQSNQDFEGHKKMISRLQSQRGKNNTDKFLSKFTIFSNHSMDIRIIKTKIKSTNRKTK